MTVLSVIALLGLNAYAKQLVDGLVTTGMTDQVSWGLYIANFTFLVGIAASAAMLVIPVYVYRNRTLHDLVIFGELLAVVAIIMCLMFVTADLGRVDRFHHLFRRFNFPISMLTWDVVVLSVYLLLNLHICGYLIYCAYMHRKPSRAFYVPFVFFAIGWAVSIHTVTAFLYVGLGGRPFWNSAIIAPRFLASAFAAGPAFLILALVIVRAFTAYDVPAKAIATLRSIVAVALTINMFLLGCEVFTEFYTDAAHGASARYLFLGAARVSRAGAVDLDRHRPEHGRARDPLHPGAKSERYLSVACVLMIVGIWIEKGMGLIVPAFVPTPLGEIVEYTPTLNEILVSFGIWAFGLLLFTVFIRITIPVLSGRLAVDRLYLRGVYGAASGAPAAGSDPEGVPS